MSSKKSAFSVFKASREKPLNGTPHPVETERTFIRSNTKRKPSKENNENVKQNLFNETPSENIIPVSKSEQRLNAIRKSIRRKKRENHHEVELKKVNREKGVKQVFERAANWAESLQDLNSSSLEETFIPEVRKHKKEQEILHQFPHEDTLQHNKFISTPNISKSSKNEHIHRKRPSSISIGNSNECEKPLKKIKPSTSSTENKANNEKTAEEIFSWIISPINIEKFFSEVWQKKPLFIKRRQPQYNKVWFSTAELDHILKTKNVQFTRNLDIALFRDGKRETLNPDGRAFAPIVWKFYEEGCSVRLLNPQTYSKNIWYFAARLQEYFGCFVGANLYLTPPGSQGFAPHYDDIEAFIIQLEGEKHWKLYSARDTAEVLPRYSSKNLSQDEIGEPILDRVLQPGDCLYFPRGVIHQASTPTTSHSLHLTLSVYQKSCWSDFMEKLVPLAVQTAIEEDVEFRKGLPLGYNNYVGVCNSEKNSAERKSFMKTVEELMKKLVSYVSVDQAADELVLDQMEEYLPPCLDQEELDCTVLTNGLSWNDTSRSLNHCSGLTLETEVRITRPGIARIIPFNENVQISHTVANSRQYKEFPLQSFEVPLEHSDIAEFYLSGYPEYVRIRDAPSDESDLKLSIATKLYNTGLIRTRFPFGKEQ